MFIFQNNITWGPILIGYTHILLISATIAAELLLSTSLSFSFGGSILLILLPSYLLRFYVATTNYQRASSIRRL